MAVTIFKPIYFPGRYTIISLPCLAVLLRSALSRVAPRSILLFMCYLVITAELSGKLMLKNFLPEGAPGGFRQLHSDKLTAQYLAVQAAPGTS